MKKFIFSLLGIILTFNLWAQNPTEHYAIIQKTNGDLVKNKEVDLKISVFQNLSDSFPAIMVNQSLITNSNGIVTIELFKDSSNIDFSKFNWNSQTYFIKIETKPEFTAFILFKTSRLDTVNENFCYVEADPFFNYSVASKISSKDTSNWNKKQNRLKTGIGLELIENTIKIKTDFYLGQDTLGGIVYDIFIGRDGKQHGLIVSKIEAYELKWQNICYLTKGIRTWDGAYNTNLMVNSPLKDWINNNFTEEWYLPSLYELNKLLDNCIYVNRALNKIGQPLLNLDGYWSSTEVNEKRAFTSSVMYGIVDLGKTNVYYARAIRTF